MIVTIRRSSCGPLSCASAAPHARQKRAPSGFSWLQTRQRIVSKGTFGSVASRVRLRVMSSLHAGTVTFGFTDIEGSTKLLQELGDETFGTLSRDHRRIVRETFGEAGGTEIDTQGDAFFFSFPRARDAVNAAVGGAALAA